MSFRIILKFFFPFLQSNLKADLFRADDSVSRGPLCGQWDEKQRETGLASHIFDPAGGVEGHLPVAFGLRTGSHREPGTRSLISRASHYLACPEPSMGPC